MYCIVYILLHVQTIEHDMQENRLLPSVGPCGQEVDVGSILSLVDALVEHFNILSEEERRQCCKSGERKRLMNRSSMLY